MAIDEKANGGRSDEAFGGGEETTAPGDAASVEANALRNMGLALNALARDLGETARLIDVVGPDERGGLLRGVAAKLGELGDLAHDARRLVRDCAG